MERDSLSTYLGSLTSEDLLRKADALRSLEGHPGWQVVQELVSVQAEKAMHQMVHRPLRDAAAYAHVGGYVKGLEQFRDIIEKALATARAVEQALESNQPASPATGE
jgi:hypothetical protein